MGRFCFGKWRRVAVTRVACQRNAEHISLLNLHFSRFVHNPFRAGPPVSSVWLQCVHDAAHRNVWPALLTKLKEVGISNYSIYRREQDLFLVMQVDDFDTAWRALDQDPINLQWQKEMALLFEPVPGLKPGEKFAMMKEVFYLE